jgi:N-acetylneuraminic acid mutarotase
MHGGENNQGSGYTGTYLYDPKLDSWSLPTPAPSGTLSVESLHQSFGLTTLTTGRVLLAGGTCRLCIGSEPWAFRFDPATDTWTRTSDLNIGRESHLLAALPGGKALAAGGYATNWDDPEPRSYPRSAEVFDSADGTWRITSDMHADHGTGMTATTLANGRVLVAGGGNINQPTATAFAEVYIP